MEWDRQEELGGSSNVLGGSIAGYAVMMEQQHGAESRMEEEAMAESIIITCRRNEARRQEAVHQPSAPSLLAVPFTCRRHLTSPH